MKQTFYELIDYLSQNMESFYYDSDFDFESLTSEILAFASEVEKQIN